MSSGSSANNSAKRYNNANLNSLFDKPSGQGSATSASSSAGVHKGMLILQGHRANQRTRLAPHPSGGKLAVPKPVNLPSLRKENQGNDPNTQLVPASGGSGSWHKTDEQLSASEASSAQNQQSKGSGAWHASAGGVSASQPPQGSSGSVEVVTRILGTVPEGQDSQFMNQEEYPTLEAATHNKPILKGKKPDKSPKSSRGTPKESQDGLRTWSEDDRPSQRRSWFEDERLAPSDSFGGYSSWGDTEYRPPPYSSHSGRGSYSSYQGPYYAHDQGMYSGPSEGDRDRGGYSAGRGMSQSFSESHQRDVYHGHQQHSPYMSGGSYHHEYRPSYEYGGDPYMDRSLFPPPPPPPPPPRSKEGDDDEAYRHTSEGVDPEREEYNAEVKKRAMELGAKMEMESESQLQSSGTSQLETPAEGQVKLVRRTADGSARVSTSQLARLPGDDVIKSSIVSSSSPSNLAPNTDDVPEAAHVPHTKESGHFSKQKGESESLLNDQDFPLPSHVKVMDWEAQVDAEEKAKAAKRERAIRDAQMRLEPPTLLKPAPRSDEVVAPVQVLRTSMPAQTVPPRNVKTQSIGIQAQPPTPPAARDVPQKLEGGRGTLGESGTSGTSVSPKGSSTKGHSYSDGPSQTAKPVVPGPWGQRPPASVQAQRQAHATVRPPPSLPSSPPPSPGQLNQNPPKKLETPKAAEIEKPDQPSRGQYTDISHRPHDSMPSRLSDGYGGGHHSARSDMHRHSRDNISQRHNRERGRGRGRGNTRYESRADQADWRQPRDPEAKQHLGKMRSDYVSTRGGRQGMTSSSDHRSSVATHSPAASQTRPGSHVDSAGDGFASEVHSGPVIKSQSRVDSVGSTHSRKLSQPSFRSEENIHSPAVPPNPGMGTNEGPGRVQNLDRNPHNDGLSRRDGTRRSRVQVGKEKGRYESASLRPHHNQGPREKVYEVVQGSARSQGAPQDPAAGYPSKGPSYSSAAPTGTGSQYQKSSSEAEEARTSKPQSKPVGNVIQSTRSHVSPPPEAQTQQPAKDQKNQTRTPARVPLASGAGSHLQSSNTNPLPSVESGHVQDTPIQFGQFHMRSLLYGMPGGAFSAPPGQFGSLNTGHLNPGTAQGPVQHGKKAEDVGKTGQGVDCLPQDLIETSLQSNTNHKPSGGLTPASTAPAASPSQVPAVVVNGEARATPSGEQSHHQSQPKPPQLHGHSHRGRGHGHRGGRGGRGPKGRGSFSHDRLDNAMDNIAHGRQQSGDLPSARSDTYSRGPSRSSGGSFSKGSGRGSGGNRGEGTRHDQSGRVAQGPDRGERGGGRSFDRGRQGRGMPGRSSGKTGEPSSMRSHGVLRMDEEQGAPTDHHHTDRSTDHQGERGNQDVSISGHTDRGRGRGRGRGHMPGRGRGRGIHETGRGGPGRGQDEHGISRENVGVNRGRGGGRGDRGGHDGGRGGHGRGRGRGRVQGESTHSMDSTDKGVVSRGHTNQNDAEDGKGEIRQHRRDGSFGRGRGPRGGRGRGRGRSMESVGGQGRQTWVPKTPSEKQGKPQTNPKT